MNVIGSILNELYRIFSILNHDKFDDSLPEPVITIQKTRGATLGHFTLDKVWRNKKNIIDNNIMADENDEFSYYEINVDPRWFYNRSADEVAETLLHEMVHYYNKILDIKDCNGNIHNKKFKTAAERVGLIVEKGSTVGWGYTALSDELKEYIHNEVKPDESVFNYFRTGKVKENKPRTKTMFKYICPECGQVVKGKRDISVKCGNCDIEMEIEDEE